MAVNKKNVKRLIKHLEAIPSRRFDQDTFCGSACCVAGHAAILDMADKGFQVVVPAKSVLRTSDSTSADDYLWFSNGVKLEALSTDDVALRGRRYLGLRVSEADALFRHGGDPHPETDAIARTRRDKIAELEALL
jgi:hypothetical protein